MTTSTDDKDDDQSCESCSPNVCIDPNTVLYGKPVFQVPGGGQGYD